MLLLFIICHLSVFVAANPFHKYPFVFLLDIGNEELEKTNSEQIRVSVPGGSIALRYPAIGYGNNIGHIRVSGIDFGTDLKASIVDGGPGYKYVVLVFMGKPGTPYDAVVTVQTVIDNNINIQNVENVINSEPNTYETEDDKNDSAEDLSDTDVTSNVKKGDEVQSKNAELMQSSSNIYSYADNESGNETEDDDDDDNDDEYNTDTVASNNQVHSGLDDQESIDKQEYEEVNNAKDIHAQYIDDIDKEDSKVLLKDIDLEDDDDDDDEEETDGEDINQTEYAEPEVIHTNSNSNYEDQIDNLYFRNQVYSQEELEKNSRPAYQEDPLDYMDPYSEDISDETDKHRDFNNNNYVDSDDSYAVAY